MDYGGQKGLGRLKQKSYYVEIGRKLKSAFLPFSSEELASAKIRALIADVVQEDSDLIAPLFELARSGELGGLIGAGHAPFKKYIVQQRLAHTFSSALVERVGFVLEGLFGVPLEETEVLAQGNIVVNDRRDSEKLALGSVGSALASGVVDKLLPGSSGRLRLSPTKKFGLFLFALLAIIAGFGGGMSFVLRRAGNPATLNSESTKEFQSPKSRYVYGADENILQCDERMADRWMRAEKCTALEEGWKGRPMIFASHADYCRYFRGNIEIDRLCKQGAPVSEGYEYSSPDLSCAQVLDPYETPCVMPMGRVGEMKEVAFKSKHYFCSVYGHEICDPSYRPLTPAELQDEHAGR